MDGTEVDVLLNLEGAQVKVVGLHQTLLVFVLLSNVSSLTEPPLCETVGQCVTPLSRFVTL